MKPWLMAAPKHYHISVWKTDNISTGSSNDNQVKLPLESGGTYNFTVNWGDGKTDLITAYDQAEVTHTYATIGTYKISVKGICHGFRFNNVGDVLKILEIKNWGRDFIVSNSNSVFYGCTNLNVSARDYMNITGITVFGWLFLNCTNLTGTIKVDTKGVYWHNSMFNNCAKFNAPVNYDTRNSIAMDYMFIGCAKFNQPVNFNSANVADMGRMFSGCTVFNSPVTLNTSNVTTMLQMFMQCLAFNKSLTSFDTSKVTIMANMFQECYAFNQSVAHFNTSKVTNMSGMFAIALAFNQDLSAWDTSKVTDMSYMFVNCTAFNQDLSAWNIESVTTLNNFLTVCPSFSRTNYDKLLVSWAAQNVQDGVTFSTSAAYTLGGTAEAARTHLIDIHAWSISDGGGV
jgi:surface protein